MNNELFRKSPRTSYLFLPGQDGKKSCIPGRALLLFPDPTYETTTSSIVRKAFNLHHKKLSHFSPFYLPKVPPNTTKNPRKAALEKTVECYLREPRIAE